MLNLFIWIYGGGGGPNGHVKYTAGGGGRKL
jgi:hypothetical protein